MSSTDSEIKRGLQALMGSKGTYYMCGRVSGVSGETCSVETEDDGLVLSGVRLKAGNDGDDNSMLVTPKIGSTVLVADLTGEMRELVAIAYTGIESIKINGGNNGGMINIVDLVSKINTIEKSINTLKNAMKSWVVVPRDGGAALKTAVSAWTGSTLTLTKRGDIEDTKITH